MEKNQYELCASVLRRLDDAGVLPGMVIIGSWCVLFYEGYFNTPGYGASIRTRDLDLAIPLPPCFGQKVDLAGQLGELGFVVDFKGRDGYIRFLHPDLIVEFLVPERGRGSNKPFDVPTLGINAQPLRFLDLLLGDTIAVPFRSVNLRLPHPANFAIHNRTVFPDAPPAFGVSALALASPRSRKPLVGHTAGVQGVSRWAPAEGVDNFPDIPQ